MEKTPKHRAGTVKHGLICRDPKLALDWLILKGYTRKAALRLLGL